MGIQRQVAGLLTLTLLAGCAARERAYGDDNGGAGGSSEDSTDQSGGSSSGGGTATSSLSLHAASVVDLGDNLYRVTYDFSTEEQLLDWVVSDSATTQLSLQSGALQVAHIGTSETVALAQFVLPVRTTALTLNSQTAGTSFSSSIPHTNIYLATEWAGNWTVPGGGYGCVFNTAEGRFFVVDGSAQSRSQPMLIAGQTYEHSITMSSSTLSWSLSTCSATGCGIDSYDALAYESAAGLFLGTTRHLLLGGWETTVEFDNVVIEGYFGSE